MSRMVFNVWLMVIHNWVEFFDGLNHNIDVNLYKELRNEAGRQALQSQIQS